MKKFLFIVSILLSSRSYAQQNSEFFTCLTSPKVDTLFLPNNDFGSLIASAWKNSKEKPVIVFKEEEDILNLMKNTLYLNSAEKRKIMNQYK